MANEFIIKNGYFSQGNSNVTGSVAITQNVTASKALFSSSNGSQLTAIGSGSTVAQVHGSQGNLLVVNDNFSGSIFTVTDISGYPILDVTSDYYTGSVFLPMLQLQSQQHVVVYNSASGLLTYTSASVVAPGGPNKSIQFNSNQTFSGSSNFTFDSASNALVLTGSLLVSGGFIVNNAINASKSIDSTLSNLYYSDGDVSVGWADSQLRDTATAVSVNWDSRILVAGDNSTTHIDWSAANAIKLPGVSSAPITQLLGINGSSEMYATPLASIGANSTSSVIGNGISSSYNINHGFNTMNLHITVYENFAPNYETVYPDIRRVNNNTASIVFANPVSAVNQYVVYISQ